MKHLIGTILIFLAVMAVAFMGTNFLLDKNASAQSGLTATSPQDESFISQKINLQLSRLNQLESKISGSIFKNPLFQSLKDFSQPIPDEQKGKQNPFAPPGV